MGCYQTILRGIGGGQHHHRHVCQPGGFAQTLQNLDSIVAGQVEVENDQFEVIRSGSFLRDQAEYLFAVGGNLHGALDSMLFQRLANQINIRRVILGEQYPLHLRSLRVSRTVQILHRPLCNL